MKTPITVAHGDGIGPEIMESTLAILSAAGAQLDIHTIDIGQKVYLNGNPAGIAPQAWEVLNHTKVFLKGPITTPLGGGYKSLNVAARKRLGLYANIRPCISYFPFIKTKHPKMDITIIRENEEDLYAGIEYQQSSDLATCLKIISHPASERIIRYAFEYAKANNKKKVSCFTKDNIMKLTDGIFHKAFESIGEEYPDIQKDHWIIDIAAAKIAQSPELFEVVVTSNLYGDIVSDIAAEITGSVGLVGTANIGTQCAMFEAIHGSAPAIAGKNCANPSALILASVMMLDHIGQGLVAQNIHNSWLYTIEQGIHTVDIYDPEISKAKVNTQDFTKAIINHLGKKPELLPSATHKKANTIQSFNYNYKRPVQKKCLVGVDIFVEYNSTSIDPLITELTSNPSTLLLLKSVTNRGLEVWPELLAKGLCVDQYRCRYLSKEQESIPFNLIIELLKRFDQQGLSILKTENLYTFDGNAGFSKDQ